MNRLSFSLSFHISFPCIMLKWKQKSGKRTRSRTFAWFVSTYFARILYSACQRHKFKNPLQSTPPPSSLSLSHSVSFSLSVLLSPSLSEGLSGWVTWAYVRPHRADWCAPAKKLALALPLSITQPKQFRKASYTHSPYFPLSLPRSHSSSSACKNTNRNKSSRAAQTSSQT